MPTPRFSRPITGQTIPAHPDPHTALAAHMRRLAPQHVWCAPHGWHNPGHCPDTDPKDTP